MENKIRKPFKLSHIIIVLLFINWAACCPRNICDNAEYNISIVQGTNSSNDCYYDITFDPKWNHVTGMDCDINQLPHGLFVGFTNAIINNTSILGGTTASDLWVNNATQTLGSNYVYWNSEPLGSCANPINAIPSEPFITVRVSVTPTSNNVSVEVKNLIGLSWPNSWQSPVPTGFSDCGITKHFSPPSPAPTYDIGNDISVCVGTLMQLVISPPPPAGSEIDWYFSTDNPCPGIDPTMSGWTLPSYQGPSFNAGYLTDSNYCFVAKIKTGCYTYYSNIRQIEVCDGIHSGTISADPTSNYQVLEDVNANNEWHACMAWEGDLLLTLNPNVCAPSISWEMREKHNDQTWSSWNSIPGTNQISTGLLVSDSCNRSFQYRAKMQNACGTAYANYTIVIDGMPYGGVITAQTNDPVDIGIGTLVQPIVCDETRLVFHSSCGTPMHWEFREEITPCSGNYPVDWDTIQGSQGTNQWWTNPSLLTKNTQYRVWVENGACNNYPPTTIPPSNGVYTAPITVMVIPDPTVSITTNTNLICGGTSPTLQALSTLNCIPVNIPTSYQWYRDGFLIPGATSTTYNPSVPGNYYVIKTSDHCHESAVSNVIPICEPKLDIIGPCCICPGDTVLLEAVISNMDACIGLCIPTYVWSTGHTTQQILIDSPGTYTVTVNCGSCILTHNITITECP